MKFGVAPFSVIGVALPNVGAPGAVMQVATLQEGGGLEKDRTVGVLLLDELLLEELLLLEEVLLDELLVDELLVDELLLDDVLLLAVVVVGAAPPPPPPLEQAARARRQADNVSRMARREVPIAPPRRFLSCMETPQPP